MTSTLPAHYRMTMKQEDILNTLTALHQSGVRITRQELRRAGHAALVQAADRFGGLQRLRRLAGIPSGRHAAFQVAGASELLAELRRRHARRESLSRTRAPTRLQLAAERHYGGWTRALQVAGLDVSLVSRRHRYSDDELLDELRALFRAAPIMTLTELERHRIGSTVRARFGSLLAAARRAGIDEWPRRQSRSTKAAPRPAASSSGDSRPSALVSSAANTAAEPAHSSRVM